MTLLFLQPSNTAIISQEMPMQLNFLRNYCLDHFSGTLKNMCAGSG